jgi:phage/plasmid primase-like uncharacterized protein
VGDFLTVQIYNAKGKVVGQADHQPDRRQRSSPRGCRSRATLALSAGQLGDVAYVTEGWADAATIAHVTGMATVFGLNDKNMTKAIAESRKAVKPGVTFIVAADNDEPGQSGRRAVRGRSRR